jgi:hypothetical protein
MAWREQSTVVSVAVVVALVGCDKSSEPTQTPEPQAAVAQPEPAPEPEPEPEADDDELDDDEAAEESDEDEGGLLDPVEAYGSAESAASEVMGATAFVLTPALPPSWPLEGADVEYLVYPLTPMETGVNRYTLGQAKLRVVMSAADGTTRTEELPAKGKKALGKTELGRGLTASDPVRGAERALFQVATGAKTAEQAKFSLYAYDKWLDGNDLIGADVRKRKPEFSKFLVSVTK